jgi:hypothetical protein
LAFLSEREADHSTPSNAEVEEWVELYLHSPNKPSWRGAQGDDVKTIEHTEAAQVLVIPTTEM